MTKTEDLNFKGLADQAIIKAGQLDDLVIVVYEPLSAPIPFRGGVSGRKYLIGGQKNPILVDKHDAELLLQKGDGKGRTLFRTLTKTEMTILNETIAETKEAIKAAPAPEANIVDKTLRGATKPVAKTANTVVDDDVEYDETDLVTLKGIGPATAQLFVEVGITSVAELAEYTLEDLVVILGEKQLPKTLNLEGVLALAQASVSS